MRAFLTCLFTVFLLITAIFHSASFAQTKSGKGKTKIVKASSNRPLRNQPKWLVKVIDDFKKRSATNPSMVITAFEYKDAQVYFVPSYCCDIRSILYSAEGKFICSPDGGMTGKGDGKCPDFYQERKKAVVIWKDTRKK